MSALLNRLDPVELNAEAGGQEQIPIPSTEDILKCQVCIFMHVYVWLCMHVYVQYVYLEK